VIRMESIEERYRDGDTEERVRVLEELNRLAAVDAAGTDIPDTGIALVRDALRTNDPRLVAAAMGAFAERHLPDHDWRHGVVKLVFMGVPLSVVSGLDVRADAELSRMAEDLAEEREAAGRAIPDDLRALLPAGRALREEAR
jgi:hypothetical protein